MGHQMNEKVLSLVWKSPDLDELQKEMEDSL